MIVADTCKINATNTGAASVIASKTLKNKREYSFTAEEIESWEPRVIDEDGFIYLRLYTEVTGGGTVTLTTTAPEEEDPKPIVYPAATVHVTCGEKEPSGAQNITVKVSNEQDIVIYDAASVKVAEWHQTPTDSPHSLKLQPGDYILAKKKKKIAIVIKN